MWSDPDWLAYVAESAKLGALEAQENKLMNPVAFFPDPLSVIRHHRTQEHDPGGSWQILVDLANGLNRRSRRFAPPLVDFGREVVRTFWVTATFRGKWFLGGSL